MCIVVIFSHHSHDAKMSRLQYPPTLARRTHRVQEKGGERVDVQIQELVKHAFSFAPRRSSASRSHCWHWSLVCVLMCVQVL